ncbi:redox-regulated ATPase YchF [Fusibacter paucivorans]|uniref:Ribosome-binding ATPase YchF n=1 Tax=Fusibacter paucivorans TaxID=76009 RepID=A0ABS5PRN9_9FIRM|nr:redox-regulated ATPase YchF [Fusibacter paucivorans]MBS7527527.1 redox-regulated ATPase YchF [Fusibacter paucivorans]
MKLGIVGLPNVGKSTLFNAITKAGAESANYPFCTIEPNVGVVAVPDERLTILRDMYDSKKLVPTSIEFYDIAGLVRGASKGEGLGNQFLSHIREVASIIHVVRCFEDENVVHVDGKIGPSSDIETINYELILSDAEMIDRRIQKTQKQLKGDKTVAGELALLERVKKVLDEGLSARTMTLTEDEETFVKSLNLLSYKPIIYCANVSEEDIISGEDNAYVKEVRAFAETENAEVVVICGKIEQEIAELDDEDRTAFLEELGLNESGLDKLVRSCYHLLDLISFLTAGPQEVRAWTIRKGTKAPQAAGKIHSDIERGFIRAEVIAFDDLNTLKNMTAAKEAGKLRLEGKEYIVQDGDVVHFRFNV